ncbi:hypothetical protein DFJ77DRAFT_495485 [Powellomyces hirtus]|nr:hypothetical protein DFJ77DRAFT_495485 [Powellomyces hirtus]
MSNSIKNVILIGAGGNLGPSVLKGLLDANKFNVSILARNESTSTFPEGITVHRTDYSEASLLSAFKGQDAIVSNLGGTGHELEKKVIDAALKVGVRRFIPSGFGSNIENEKTLSNVAYVGSKATIVQYLRELAEKNPNFTWTAVTTGAFFDWGLQVGFLGFDLKKHTATILDGGNHTTSYTNLATIGKAVANILSQPAETANRSIYISSFATTQNQLLAALEAATATKFTATHLTTDDVLKQGGELVAAGDLVNGIGALILGNYYQPGTGHHFEQDVSGGVANSLLGLPKETLEESVKAVIAY